MLLCQPWKNTSDPSGKRSLSERAVYARSCIGASVRTSREEKELKGSLPENLVDQGQCMRPNHSLRILHKSSATLSRLEIYFQMRTCPALHLIQTSLNTSRSPVVHGKILPRKRSSISKLREAGSSTDHGPAQIERCYRWFKKSAHPVQIVQVALTELAKV